jgi:predicted NAD/FAD-binding protein
MRFYREHSIPLDKTDMSFAIQHRQYEWSFVARPANIARLFATPSFWSFLLAKNRFHSDALSFLAGADAGHIDARSLRQTLEDFCKEHGYADAFVIGWLSPFCQAVWSTAPTLALKMEAYTILSFLRNHGFLSWTPVQWYTPKGRSKVTIDCFQRLFAEHSVTTRTGAKVAGVRPSTPTDKTQRPLVVELANGECVDADHVVLATPSGTALPLLKSPTPLQREVLQHFRGSKNHVVLHTSPALMPKLVQVPRLNSFLTAHT